MSGSLNKMMIIGNVGRDPEMRFTQAGTAVCSFSVGVSYKEETEWFNIVAWNKLAETCNTLVTKGRKIHVEGRMKTRSWDDKTSGEKKYRTELVAGVIVLLDSKPGDTSTVPDVEDDSIPF